MKGTTHHPSLAYRQEHVCRVRPAAFSKDTVGAEVQTAGAAAGAAAEGRWHGRSHRRSASVVDGLITACVGFRELTAEALAVMRGCC